MTEGKTRKYSANNDFESADKFAGKITALFLPYLPDNISEKEWLRFQGEIVACFKEYSNAHIPGREKSF